MAAQGVGCFFQNTGDGDNYDSVFGTSRFKFLKSILPMETHFAYDELLGIVLVVKFSPYFADYPLVVKFEHEVFRKSLNSMIDRLHADRDRHLYVFSFPFFFMDGKYVNFSIVATRNTD